MLAGYRVGAVLHDARFSSRPSLTLANRILGQPIYDVATDLSASAGATRAGVRLRGRMRVPRLHGPQGIYESLVLGMQTQFPAPVETLSAPFSVPES